MLEEAFNEPETQYQAACELAEIFYREDETDPGLQADAFYYLERAVELRADREPYWLDTEISYRLAKCWENGWGTERNLHTAIEVASSKYSECQEFVPFFTEHAQTRRARDFCSCAT